MTEAATPTPATRSVAPHWHSVWPVWALAAVGVVVVAVLVPVDRIVWLPIVLGACTVASFAIQLGLPNQPGLVNRLFAAVVGTLVVLAAATVAFAALAILG